MKQHIEVLKDSFIDFAGLEHHFVLSAISEVIETDTAVFTAFDEIDYDFINRLPKGLKLGLSICNPSDTFNEQVGVLKATARANNSDYVLYVTDSGLINTPLVQALLLQEATYIKNNPEKYIKGYAEAKETFLKRQKMIEMKDHFSAEENAVVEQIQKNPKFLDNVKVYLDWLRKQCG